MKWPGPGSSEYHYNSAKISILPPGNGLATCLSKWVRPDHPGSRQARCPMFQVGSCGRPLGGLLEHGADAERIPDLLAAQ